MPKSRFRHTKVIFTLGPATNTEPVLAELIRAGADVCRLNMAHASPEWTREAVARIRKVCAEVGRTIAIMMDVKGPEIRTGDLPEAWTLLAGEPFDLLLAPGQYRDGADGQPRGVSINYPGLVDDMKPGDPVLVDSGLLRLVVRERRADALRCEVVVGGEMKSRRHINLPGVHVRLPALTQKDRADIRLGVEVGVDYFALSFVREADDLDMLRRFLTELRSSARIIAKIEDQAAITNLDEIIRNADALMVARGDLGIEVPFEQLPVIQRRAVETCLTLGKPVIIATHVMESMISSPLPTRAEITDAANAVTERADCIMLSGETTIGLYPVECVRVLNRIIASMEENLPAGRNERMKLKTPKAKMMRSAAVLAEELDGASIMVFTRSGFLAQVLSTLRPVRCRIFAFTDEETVFRQMLMLWGVEPFFLQFSDQPNKTIGDAMAMLKEQGWTATDEIIVVITNVLADERVIDSVQLRKVE